MTKTEERILSPRLRAKAGYTLLEILIVLAIIGLIVGLVSTQYSKIFDGAKVKTTNTEMHTLMSQLDVMQLDIGRYPTAAEGLSLLVQAPGDGAAGWNGPYLKGDLPKDAWGHDYAYQEPGEDGKPAIVSLGNDGKADNNGGGKGNAADIVLH